MTLFVLHIKKKYNMMKKNIYKKQSHNNQFGKNNNRKKTYTIRL